MIKGLCEEHFAKNNFDGKSSSKIAVIGPGIEALPLRKLGGNAGEKGVSDVIMICSGHPRCGQA